jgi:phosphomannomutase
VAEVVTLDGTKVVFDNGWWFGVRPSGTEPVVRPYVETSAAPGADAGARADAAGWQRAIMAWLRAEIAAVIA